MMMMIAAAAYLSQDLAKCIMTNPTAVPWSTIANATHSLLDKRLMASDLGENESYFTDRPRRIERRVSRPTIDGADATFSSIVTGVLTFTVFVTLIGFLTRAWFVQQQSHPLHCALAALVYYSVGLHIVLCLLLEKRRLRSRPPSYWLLPGWYIYGATCSACGKPGYRKHSQSSQGSIQPALTTAETSKIVVSVFVRRSLCCID